LFITDLERRAARQLSLEKPWLYDPKPLPECPACGEKIKHGVAVCRACGAILDKEKAAQYGLVAKDRPRREARDSSDRQGSAEKPGSIAATLASESAGPAGQQPPKS
jgi:hypothetical protein